MVDAGSTLSNWPLGVISVCAAGAAVFDHTSHGIGGISAATLAYEVAGSDDEVGRHVVHAAREVSRAGSA